MKIHRFLMFACLLVLPGLLLAQSQTYPKVDWGVHPTDFEQVGMSGWQFLKLPTNARIASLAGTTTGIGRGDANSAFGNPALISDVENMELGISSMTWLVDIKYNSASLVKNFGALGTIGVNVIFLDYGDMYRTENREIFDEKGNSTGQTKAFMDMGTYTANDYSIGLSYSRRITDRFQVGGTAKYIHEKLDDAGAGQWALDVGTMFYTGFKTLRISMVGRNFGPDVSFVTYDDRLGIPASNVKMPMVFALGTAIDLLEASDTSPHLLTLAAEFTHPNDGPEKLHLATEYGFMKFVFLRGGYRFNYDEEGLTIGGGIHLKTASFGVKIDYAYLDFGRLDQVHMFTLGIGM